MSMCRVFPCAAGKGCLLWPVHSLGKSPLTFALLPWGFSVPLPDPKVEKSLVCPKTFAKVRERLWYNYSPVCGSSARWFHSGANSDPHQKELCHTPPRCAAAGNPVPTANFCWVMSPQETLKDSKAGLAHSLVEAVAPFPGSWCTQAFVCALRASLKGMRFDFKCDCSLPTILLGLLLCSWMQRIFFFFVGIQHSPVDGCSAASCDFSVFSKEQMSACPSTPPSYFT